MDAFADCTISEGRVAMKTDTEAYKGRKFTCNNCGYVVSSDATDDFDVEDFSYCPYCGVDESGAKKQPKEPIRCLTCTHYIADEVPPICYLCCKGIEDNYKKRGE